HISNCSQLLNTLIVTILSKNLIMLNVTNYIMPNKKNNNLISRTFKKNTYMKIIPVIPCKKD
ncbi:hypothetical protein, partial [Clostridium sp. C8-1-8]|uniref:hypothetical protein n=1 Tax=Clostridium sp. C8-1-8 TaxID=2698831 RepID=UPI001A9B4B61